MAKITKDDEIVTTDFEINIDKAIEGLHNFKSQLARYLHTAMAESLDIVGLRAVQKYMNKTKAKYIKEKQKWKLEGLEIGGSLLNIRTGRLARSVLNTYSYAGSAGGAKEGIRSVKASYNGIFGIIGSKVPYAAIHEFGGTIRRGSTTITIPKRSYLGRAIQDSFVQKKINRIFTKYIEKATKA